jgi:hypothetical protein
MLRPKLVECVVAAGSSNSDKRLSDSGFAVAG